MFYESALYKVALRYPHLSLNFDGLEFDDLVLPPSSEFYYEGLAVSDPARYLLPEESSKTSPVLEEPTLSQAEGQVEPAAPSHDGSPAATPVRVMMCPPRCLSRASRNPTEDGEMLAFVIVAIFIVGYS